MSASRRLGVLFGWALVVMSFVPPAEPHTPERESFARRLLGPIASLAASAEWVRFDLALHNGETERAYLVAQRALELDPSSPVGWYTLGRHLIFDRASLEVEPDAARRRGWIRAGLDVLERGAETSSDPTLLTHLRGTILATFVAEIAEDLDWEGGRRAALQSGIAALEQAEREGFARSRAVLAYARDELEAAPDRAAGD